MRRIFDLYTRKRLGTIAIANQLREESAPAPAAGWGHPAVHRIISNPTYTGRIRWRDRLFDGVHEPLIDELTFQRAQAILRERGDDISRRRGNASDFLLSGVVRCGRCGKAYVGMSARGNGGRYEYYACSGRQKHGPKAAATNASPGTSSNTPSSSSSPPSTATGNWWQRQLRRPNRKQNGAGPRSSSGSRQSAPRSPVPSRRSSATTRPSNRASSPPNAATSGSRGLQARLEDLRAQQAELSLSTPHKPGHGPTPADLAAVADQLEDVIAEGGPQKAKALLRLLIQELRVDGRAHVQPTYRLVTPEVCATYEKVERTGIEPVTSGLQSRIRAFGAFRSGSGRFR